MEDPVDLNQLVDDFAFRCFLEMADGDYIAARMAYRTGLIPQFLWASQQALEKYPKYILLMRRIRAVNVKHDLDKAIERIKSGGIQLNLTAVTMEFIHRLDQIGQYRYLEVSHVVHGKDLLRLDRAVWEVRRYCTPKMTGGLIKLQEGLRAPRVQIAGRYLERVMGDRENPARKELLWQNGFFGRKRGHVRLVSFNGK